MRIEEVRTDLAGRLRARQGEIEQAILTRSHGVSDPAAARDPLYAEGLRAAVSAAVEYGIEAVERGENRPPPIPTTLLSQARLAARFGIRLETVLRRYFAGYTLLNDFLIEEVDREGRPGAASLKRLLRAHAALFDQVIAAVTEEYGRERSSRPGTSAERKAELIERLLDGELLDPGELGYELAVWHIGAIAVGPNSVQFLRSLAAALQGRLLLARRDQATVWAWIGRRRPPDPGLLEPEADAAATAGVSLTLGEPAQGLEGWRLTHRQAAAALPIAMRSRDPLVRYGDVAVLASVVRDDLLTTSLHQIYLAPLEDERDGGKVARETLRAYFGAERNLSSAAAALGINRHTVASRLSAIEEKLKRPIASHAADLEAALRLDELSQPGGSSASQQPHWGGEDARP
ncbi:MAG TPA: helix-turn-helix domain-containing protein [Solirubrobacterales bacterium]|nr:helix-turn-helix domain-containing protein [Solirubrobacterales bacterium]